MTSQDLKNYILKNNKIEYILEKLGCHSISFHSDKNYWTATRPDSNADNPMGVVICQNEYLNYFSYSKGIHLKENRDLFYLIQKTKNISFASTMRYVHDLFGLNYSFNRNKHNEEKEEKPNILAVFENASESNKKRKINVLDYKPLDNRILDDYEPIIHISWFREGIMPCTSKKFGLCYSYKYHRQIIPIRYWMDGSLMGMNARTTIENWDELGIKKYFLTKNMPKEINLYGLWENYESIQKAGYVVVYEAEKSVLKRDSLFDSTGVALSGHSMSQEQIQILLGLDVNIIISMDNDVDIQEVRHMCEHFWLCRNVYYTWDKHALLPPKSSIADAKNSVFDFLMKYKIKYDENEHRKYLKGLEIK